MIRERDSASLISMVADSSWRTRLCLQISGEKTHEWTWFDELKASPGAT